jgi:hypothetical protein
MRQQHQSSQLDNSANPRDNIFIMAIASYLSQLQFDKYIGISKRLYDKWMNQYSEHSNNISKGKCIVYIPM